MKLILKIAASVLLLFNGIGAIYGGLSFMIHPDGSGLQMSLDFLKHTPFHNYFVPGIILFTANGLFSVFVLLSLLLKWRNSAWLVMFQGSILTGWIVIQVILIQTVVSFHYIMGSIGIVLLVIGRYLVVKNDDSVK